MSYESSSEELPKDRETSAATPIRVLLVEDDDDFVGDVKSIAQTLHGESIVWSRARGVEEAMSIINSSDVALPNVAVVDVGLEDGSGLDFVRQVREKNFIFPIVVISQNELGEVRYDGRPISRPQLIEIGANEFQSKSQISNSQKEFLKFVISIAGEFDRLFTLTDRPDREFHSSLSKQALIDLRLAASICRSGAVLFERRADDQNLSEKSSKQTIAFLIETVASRERMRLDYLMKLSAADKVRAFSIDAVDPKLNVAFEIERSRLEEVVDGISKSIGKLFAFRLPRSR